MIASIQNIKFEAFWSLQRGFYGIPYIGYFIAADVLHRGMSLVISYDGYNKSRMNDYWYLHKIYIFPSMT
jgi:hypothetical protein